MSDVPPIPAAIAVVPVTSQSVQDEQAGPGELLERHKNYAQRFNEWLLGLNRHDFMQAKKLLDAMMHAYAKHTMKIHSPPARKDEPNVSGTKSDGAPDPSLPPGGSAA